MAEGVDDHRIQDIRTHELWLSRRALYQPSHPKLEINKVWQNALQPFKLSPNLLKNLAITRPQIYGLGM